MAQQSMIVTGHGIYSPVVYTLLNSGGTGLLSVTVLCNAVGTPLWGSFFGVAATVGVPAATYASLWADVVNSERLTTISLQVTGTVVNALSWVTS